jgi:hypothetical protein
VYDDRNLKFSLIIALILRFVARIRTVLCLELTVVDAVHTITTKTHLFFTDNLIEKRYLHQRGDVDVAGISKISKVQDNRLET